MAKKNFKSSPGRNDASMAKGSVTFSRLGKYGRLGNQMFQIAATMAIAKKHGMAIYFPDWEYEKYFSIDIPKINDIGFGMQGKDIPYYDPKTLIEVPEAADFSFKEMTLDRGAHIDLFGYFQSEKYFEGIKNEVKAWFHPNKMVMDELLAKYASLFASDAILCSIQVRRTDYVNNPAYAQLGMDYYDRAMNQMPVGTHFVIVSDDISWCKKSFGAAFSSGTEITFIENQPDYIQFAAMIACKHHIIANSTFAWWGAWLGEDKDSIIIAPDEWFGPGLADYTSKDIIPERWKKISVNKEQITGNRVIGPRSRVLHTSLDFADFNYNRIFIETGSCHGASIELALKARYQEIRSVEAEPTLYGFCVNKFRDNKNVRLYHGKSEDKLEEMLEGITEPCTFWLDAHPAGNNTFSDNKEGADDEDYQFEIIYNELLVICRHPVKKHTILIDDVNGLTGTAQAILTHFSATFEDYEFVLLDDQFGARNKVLLCRPKPEPIQKIYLKDVTFMLRVRTDSKDRLENMHLCLQYLNTWFDTNIMVWESAAKAPSPQMIFDTANMFMEKYGASYHFFEESIVMHYTKMLNAMAREVAVTSTASTASTGPSNMQYIWNHDVDVFMPAEQMLKAVEMLRSREADVAYPYDGRFLRCERSKFYPLMKQKMSCDIFDRQPFKKHELEKVISWGGSVVMSLETYLAGGGENENLVGWCPDDWEREIRFRKLGFIIKRVNGPLFHIDHATNENGSLGHKYTRQNTEECAKVSAMSMEELRGYVGNWIAAQGRNDGSVVRPIPADHLYLLNLPARKDRLEHSMKQLKRIGWHTDAQVWPATDGKTCKKHPQTHITPGMIGCFESHKAILRDALHKGYQSIIVMEDDLLPVPGFNKLFERAMENMPADADFVYLGSTEYGGFGAHAEEVNKYWVKPAACWGTQAYMITNPKAMEKILEHLHEMIDQLDVQLSMIVRPESGLNFYAIYPSLVGQDFENLGSDVQIPNSFEELYGKH